MQAGMNSARRLLGAKHRPQRQAAGQRLGQRGYIRLNAELLVGKPLAGTSQAGLNFIGNQQGSGGLVSSRAAAKNSCDTGRIPPSPCTGSIKTAQTSFEKLARR